MTQAPDTQQSLDQTQALIDRIEALVVNGVRIPLTSKVVIDEENLFELLDHLRAYLPVEIQQAQQVLQIRPTSCRKRAVLLKKLSPPPKKKPANICKNMSSSNRPKKWLKTCSVPQKLKPSASAMKQINTVKKSWPIWSRKSAAPSIWYKRAARIWRRTLSKPPKKWASNR